MNSVEQQTIIVLGPQGCGKGTQIQLLKDYISTIDVRPIVHFEMGKNLREIAAGTSYTQRRVAEVLREGKLIAYFVSAAVFSDYLMTHLEGGEHLIIDGFPRQKEQVAALDSAMQFYGRKLPTIVCINISDDEAVSRLMKRGRSDDTEESIRARLAWSHAETMPNIEWFRQNPAYRVLDIDGERSIEDIQKDIRTQLGL